MFNKVLIANRGEIALRVIRACHEMGIRTVAVYSEADVRAPHVREADEAVLIGPAPSSESYLRGEKIVEAAKLTGAEAIHPGYGFLSERSAFARKVIESGLVWIGPPPTAIEAMGDKITSRRHMQAAHVPIVPVAFDYGTKTIRLDTPFWTTGDPDGDIARLKEIYRNVVPKNPKNFQL